MYNGKLVYKVVIWAFLRISLWKEKDALTIEVQYIAMFSHSHLSNAYL